MPYCTVGDLLTGNIPTPAYADPTKFVQDASDEIDSYLGSLYVTPLVLDVNVPAQRPWALLLKRINSHLASGRLILAATAGDQKGVVHRYGVYLIKSAEEILKQIASGEINIPFQQAPAGSPIHVTAPIINNLDEVSNVEEFYKITKPDFLQPPRIGFY